MKVADFTKEQVDAAIDCETNLRNLKFRSQDKYEVCDDSKGLESASGKFIGIFAPWSKVRSPKSAVSSTLIFL